VAGPFRAAPPAYLIPADDEELGRLLTWCWDRAIPVIPRGGGTGMPGGNLGGHVIVEPPPPEPCEIAWNDDLALGRPGIVAPAATILGQVADVAREHGGFLPCLPSSSPWCRVGGVVANNAAGARSFRFGAAHAWVEWVEGFHPWGEPFRVGGSLPVPERFRALHHAIASRLGSTPSGWPEVRKNSSGYALDRFLDTGDPAQLLVGSEGTLAFLSRIGLRFAPDPPGRGLVLLPAHSPQELTELALGARELGTDTCEMLGRRFLEISGLDRDPGIGRIAREAFAILLIEVSGSDLEVARDIEAVQRLGARTGGRGIAALDPEEVGRLWQLRRAASPMIGREAEQGRISTQFIEDCVVPPHALGTFVEGLDEILREARFDAVIFGHAGDGNLHVNPLVDVESPDWLERVRRVLDEVTSLVGGLGGTLAGEHGDGRLRAPLLSRIYAPPHMEAFRSVKDALDPRGVLNPGTVLPLPDQDPLEGLSPRPPVRHEV